MTGAELFALSFILTMLFAKLGKRKKRRKRIARRSKFKHRSNPFKVYHEKHNPKETVAWLANRAKEMREDPEDAERLLAEELSNMGVYHKSQYVLHNIATGARAIVDEILPDHRIVIELDGFQHKDELKFDAGRDQWIKDFTGFRVCRFWNSWALEPGLADRLKILLTSTQDPDVCD